MDAGKKARRIFDVRTRARGVGAGTRWAKKCARLNAPPITIGDDGADDADDHDSRGACVCVRGVCGGVGVHDRARRARVQLT